MKQTLINSLRTGKRSFEPESQTNVAAIEFQEIVTELRIADSAGLIQAVFQKPSKSRENYGLVLLVCVKTITPIGLEYLEARGLS